MFTCLFTCLFACLLFVCCLFVPVARGASWFLQV